MGLDAASPRQSAGARSAGEGSGGRAEGEGQAQACTVAGRQDWMMGSSWVKIFGVPATTLPVVR